MSFDDQGKIIRWMDYWDGRSSNVKNVLKPTYPTAFADDVGNATGKIADVSKKLNDAMAAGDAAAAAALFHPDAVYEDMALHSQILGKLAIGRYLSRAIAKVPYGKDAKMVHVVGGDMGGGFEWTPAGSFPMKRGITAIALDGQGLISHFTVVYDSSLMEDGSYQSLVTLSAEQPLP